MKVILSVISLLAASVYAFNGPIAASDRYRYEPIPGHYIITLKEDAEVGISSHHDWLMSEIESYHPESEVHGKFDIGEGAIGYYGSFDERLIKKLAEHESVAAIEQDQMITLTYAVHLDIEVPDSDKEVLVNLKVTPNGVEEQKKVIEAPVSPNHMDQVNAPWGLSRISSRAIPSNYSHYLYPTKAGSGVDVYVVDTGIMINHREFEGRAKWGANFIKKEGDFDGNGHGTHCAGTIAGKTFGVAKNANLIAVKVLSSGGSGSNSGVIAGVNYVTKQHLKNLKTNPETRSVGSMSLGGGRSKALDAAVNGAIKAGVHFAVAAGNEDSDACDSSPAAAELAISVGASDIKDVRADFSNWGKCVHIHAPGVQILSAGIKSNSATAIMSGTSMATPHVAGALALFLAEENRTPADMKQHLIDVSTKGKLKDMVEKTANRLLNTNSLWEGDYSI